MYVKKFGVKKVDNFCTRQRLGLNFNLESK